MVSHVWRDKKLDHGIGYEIVHRPGRWTIRQSLTAFTVSFKLSLLVIRRPIRRHPADIPKMVEARLLIIFRHHGLRRAQLFHSL